MTQACIDLSILRRTTGCFSTAQADMSVGVLEIPPLCQDPLQPRWFSSHLAPVEQPVPGSCRDHSQQARFRWFSTWIIVLVGELLLSQVKMPWEPLIESGVRKLWWKIVWFEVQIVRDARYCEDSQHRTGRFGAVRCCVMTGSEVLQR